MPTYTFRCVEHGDIDHDGHEPPVCFCGERMVQVFTVPYISVNARPTSQPEAHAASLRERRWAADIPAYRRLRAEGKQPRGVDGSARLEARANTDFELKSGRLRRP